MQKTELEQEHVLKARSIQSAQWKLEDRIILCEKQSEEAVGLSMNAAMTGQKQLRLAYAKIADLDEQISIQAFSLKQQGQRLVSIDKQNSSRDNKSLACSIISAIVVSLGMTLIMSPNSDPIARPQVSQGVNNAR